MRWLCDPCRTWFDADDERPITCPLCHKTTPAQPIPPGEPTLTDRHLSSIAASETSLAKPDARDRSCKPDNPTQED